METILIILSSLLDMIILKSFLTNYFKKPKTHLQTILLYISICFIEILLLLSSEFLSNINSESYIITITNSTISIITTFFLCFFFTKNYISMLGASIVFQIMVLLSERLCLILSYFIYPSEITNKYTYVISMNLMSKIILLIFTLLYNILMKKTYHRYPVVYNILLLITPVISLCILILMPLSKDYIYSNISFFAIIWGFITFLNIIYLILTEKIIDNYNNEIIYQALQKQLNYQKDKYIQLGESYKTSRRLVHDIKHHNETMKKMIQTEKYKELYNYLSVYTNDIEKSYARFNTGNLVIDALFSNYYDLFKSEKIDFKTKIDVDITKIPISDYDLSILIGNLLDNSYKAVKQCLDAKRFVSIIISTGTKDQFTIIIENSYLKTTNKITLNVDNFQHGYGINNVKNIVNENHGIMEIDTTTTYKTTIIIPIIDIRKRTTSFQLKYNTHSTS